MAEMYRRTTREVSYYNPGAWILVGIFTFVGLLNLLGALVAFAGAGGTAGPLDEATANRIGGFYGAGPFLNSLSDTAMVGTFTTIGVVMLVLAILNFATAFGIWNLRRWAWGLGMVLAVIGLLFFPVGTVLAVITLVYLAIARPAFYGTAYREDRIERPRTV